ncbi:MAG: hypothetical protein R3F61_10135 [Myxococcota bacterium]
MLVLATIVSAWAGVPDGWFLAGSNPKNYEADVVSEAYSGEGSARYRSKADKSGFGTLMQQVGAEEYRGKRVMMSAYVKSEDVTGWSGLWLRVDGEKGMLSFDNMHDRPIEGTSAWNRYEIVLDVPEKAQGLAFGILVDGAGTVWLDDLEIEVVDDRIPLTGLQNTRSSKPVNPSFERE